MGIGDDPEWLATLSSRREFARPGFVLRRGVLVGVTISVHVSGAHRTPKRYRHSMSAAGFPGRGARLCEVFNFARDFGSSLSLDRESV